MEGGRDGRAHSISQVKKLVDSKAMTGPFKQAPDLVRGEAKYLLVGAFYMAFSLRATSQAGAGGGGRKCFSF